MPMTTSLNLNLPDIMPCSGPITVYGAIVAAAGFEDRSFALAYNVELQPGTKICLVSYKDWATTAALI
jgi:hypothetical protein